MIDAIQQLPMPPRAAAIKARITTAPRQVSIEQARLVTAVYRAAPADLPACRLRAQGFAAACRGITLDVRPGEMILGNRAPGVRTGVIFPEAAVAWIDRELDGLPTRPQDPFTVADSVRDEFRRDILPFWRGRTLEDRVYGRLDAEVLAAARVVKINQRDHAQGHIIPDVAAWLALGPAGLQERLQRSGGGEQRTAMIEALDGARDFLRRLASAANAAADGDESLRLAGQRCAALAERPATSFAEALQSVWTLFTLLHLESNASSFSFGRFDQLLWPYLERDLAAGRCDLGGALELLCCFFLKCNELVYLRNRHSAQYFAGFPIGFNLCLGGLGPDGQDRTNPLSHLCLRAQHHLGLPQPNLSLKVHRGSPDALLRHAARVIGRGSGMPQVFNDESIPPALMAQGIAPEQARDYAVVGCVELSTQGNMLGWSDAAMFNLVKCLELAINDGVCRLDGQRLGPATGRLVDMADYAAVEQALRIQIDHFLGVMQRGCAVVEAVHVEAMPSPFLSCVIDDCIGSGRDVTAGGARYNLAGVQAIQVANLADCLGVLHDEVYGNHRIERSALARALDDDWQGHEVLRAHVQARSSAFGNDVPVADERGARWLEFFADRLATLRNGRGGPVHMGLYTVSAHVPMGQNVGATPDGRRAREPLADGGVSPVYGRDLRGPTAVLRSVARLPFARASNGSLLNMKFLPELFSDDEGITAFTGLLRGWCALGIHHAQFNVLNPDDLRAARRDPAAWRHLTVRVAGYTAYFVELAPDLQDEIIARTWFAAADG